MDAMDFLEISGDGAGLDGVLASQADQDAMRGQIAE